MPTELTTTEPQYLVDFNKSLAEKDWATKRDTTLAHAKTVEKIDNNNDLELATDVLKYAKKLVKFVESKRKEITSVLDDAKKKLMSEEKSTVMSLNEEINRLNKLVTDYANEQARKAEEERLRREAAERAAAEAALAAEEAAQAAQQFGFPAPANAVASEPVLTPVVAAPTVERAKSSSASFTEVWNYEVLDANAVPRELCSPDPAKIKAFMASKKAEGYKAAEIAVAGLKFSTSIRVASR